MSESPKETGRKRQRRNKSPVSVKDIENFANYARMMVSNDEGRGARQGAKDSEDVAMDNPTMTGVSSVLNQLAYEIPKQQKDISYSEFETRMPSSVLPVEAEGLCEYYIEPSGGMCISLFDTFFTKVFQVFREDGNNLAPDEQVVPISYLLNTAFKSIRITINGQLLTHPTSQNHGIEAHLAALTQLSESTKRYQLAAGGFSPDKEMGSENITSGWLLDDNSGFMYRKNQIAGSRRYVLTGRILHELFLSAKLIPEYTELRIQFFLQPSNFMLIAGKQHKYRVKLVDSKMHLAKYKLTPQAGKRINHILSGQGLFYLFPRWDTRVISIAAGQQYFSCEVTRGRTPDKTILVLQTQKAFSELDASLNVLHFKPLELQSVRLIANGISKPAIPYQFDKDPVTDLMKAEQAYFLLQREQNLINSSLSFTVDEYVKGVTYCSFDLSSDHSAGLRSSYLSPSPDGVVNAEFKFHKNLTEPLVAIFVNEYPCIMNLRGDGRISAVI